MLENNSENMDLDETTAVIESRKSGKRSMALLTSSQNTEAVRSMHGKYKWYISNRASYVMLPL